MIEQRKKIRRRWAGHALAILAAILAAAAPMAGGGACFATAKSAAAKGDDRAFAMTLGGARRTFFMHVPKGWEKGSAGRRLPVVVMLHGSGSDGSEAARQTGWDDKADREGFLAVFPSALPADPRRPASPRTNPRLWSDGSASVRAARSEPVDDIAFLGAVLDYVEAHWPVDTQRVYLTGFSGGASMAFHAADSPQLSRRIAAVAPVAGPLWDRLAHPDRAVPALFLCGAADPLNPVGGGPVRLPWDGVEVRPKLIDTVLGYARAIGAPEQPAPLDSAKRPSGVKTVAYGPGRDGAVLLFTLVEGLGDRWPGGRDARPVSLAGPNVRRLNATDVIWTFFSRQALAE